ncbi:cysteine hydrolase family protein [Microbulbifer sp. SSSA008]|uniref:cysteine hydrolase family protein n=1 Tax=Microbulbifer sp. SSSA008 TaxID=3243380 RepID=UPI00403946C0
MADDGDGNVVNYLSTNISAALVVVDMQNDFCCAGGYYDRRRQGSSNIELETPSPSRDWSPRIIRKGDDLKKVVNNIILSMRVAKEREIPVLLLKTVIKPDHKYRNSFLRGEENRGRCHYPCKLGTWGAEIIEPIWQMAEEGVVVVDKHVYNGFVGTSLEEELLSLGVDTVFIVGVETHICVLATAQSASFRFKTYVLEDAVWSANCELAKHALSIFKDGYGYIADHKILYFVGVSHGSP